MTKQNLIEQAICSGLTTSWHWFNHHFHQYLLGKREPMVESLLDALLCVDKLIPGYAEETLKRMASAGGHERFQGHYDQLLQMLAEIFVIAQLSRYDWPSGTTFEYEPGAASGLPNPEIAVHLPNATLSVEVKSPAYSAIRTIRSREGMQLLARIGKDALKGENPVLPRDNTLKDFLLSADSKFQTMKNLCEQHYGILAIVWDDYVQEPLSALLSPASGLFTDNSFLQQTDGRPEAFVNTDGVILLRHLHQMVNAIDERPFIDACMHCFDYGTYSTFPPKAFIENPWARRFVPSKLLEPFQATPWYELSVAAEYRPAEVVQWFISGA